MNKMSFAILLTIVRDEIDFAYIIGRGDHHGA